MQYIKNNQFQYSYYRKQDKYSVLTGVKSLGKYNADYLTYDGATVYTNVRLYSFAECINDYTNSTILFTSNTRYFTSTINYSLRPTFICSDITQITSNDTITINVSFNGINYTHALPLKQQKYNTVYITNEITPRIYLTNITVTMSSTCNLACKQCDKSIGEIICKGY